MNRATRWLRHVYPPVWTLAIFFAGYGVVYTINLFQTRPEMTPAMWIGLGSAAYGTYRAIYFHPVQNASYRQWLDTTPWNGRKPLPLGPIDLVWQDLLLLAVLALLAVHFWAEVGEIRADYLMHARPVFSASLAWQHVAYGALVPFLGAYLIFLAMIMPATGRTGLSAAILLGLAATVRLILVPEAVVASLLVTYVVAQAGVRRSLAEFPWSITRPAEWTATLGQAALRGRPRQAPVIGWPHAQLGPKRIGTLYSATDAAVSGLLVSAWLYAILAHFGPILVLEEVQPVADKIWLAFTTFVWLAAGGRVLFYCANHWSPISLLGRATTGRLIVPGYDRVFLAPLCVLVVGHAEAFAMRSLEIPLQFALPLSVAVVFWLVLSLGPTWEKWHLTGSHRLMPW